MKIVVDDKIPFIREALETLADEVVAKAGREISSADVYDADILVVRTRTKCDENLLKDSRVKLVMTATIGFDHIDTSYLEASGITWTNCPGCNATSVAQYVSNCLLLLQRDRGVNLKSSTLGIIGVGHVGTAVMEAAKRLGIEHLLLNDPPREEAGEQLPGQPWTDLTTLLSESDIITIHTPLTTAGHYPTLHLIGTQAFKKMTQRPIIINAGRGGLIDERALESAMDEGTVREVVIDTWENEPNISRSLLNKVYIGTPHIAGYSADGKANATRMVLTSICHFLGRPMTFDIQPPPLPVSFVPSSSPETLALQLYNPMTDSERLKARPDAFELFRECYPLRREQP